MFFRQKVRCRLNGRKDIAKYQEGFPGTWFQGKVKSVPRSVGNLKASCHRPQRSHQDAGNLSYTRLAGKPSGLRHLLRQRCMRCKAIHQFDLVKSRIVRIFQLQTICLLCQRCSWIDYHNETLKMNQRSPKLGCISCSVNIPQVHPSKPLSRVLSRQGGHRIQKVGKLRSAKTLASKKLKIWWHLLIPIASHGHDPPNNLGRYLNNSLLCNPENATCHTMSTLWMRLSHSQQMVGTHKWIRRINCTTKEVTSGCPTQPHKTTPKISHWNDRWIMNTILKTVVFPPAVMARDVAHTVRSPEFKSSLNGKGRSLTTYLGCSWLWKS